MLLLLLNMQRSQQRARRAGAAPQEFSWVLKLLQATLVAAGKEPLLQQVAAEAGVAGPAAGKAGDSDQLPEAYRWGRRPTSCLDRLAGCKALLRRVECTCSAA